MIIMLFLLKMKGLAYFSQKTVLILLIFRKLAQLPEAGSAGMIRNKPEFQMDDQNIASMKALNIFWLLISVR